MTQAESTTLLTSTIEVEAALIGSVLKDPKQFAIIRDYVSDSDFHDIGFSACWRAFRNLEERGLSIDQVTVGDEIERAGKSQDVTFGGSYGRSALIRVREEGRAGNASSYAEVVLDYSAKRKLLELMSKGAHWSLNGRKSSDIQADMLSSIAEIQTPARQTESHVQELRESLSDAYDRTDKASHGEVRLLKTGFIDLDKMLHGLEGGDFIILAARPGQGKTAFLVNIGYNLAKVSKRVVLFSLEMQNRQIAMRLISLVSGVDYGAQKDGKMTAEQWINYNSAIQTLENYPLYLCDLPSIKTKEMRRVIRGLEAKHGKLDLVLFDYLQLGTPDDDKSKTREQEVAKVARGMKHIAKEFDVPVIAAAQLSRALESRSEKRPQLSDLRESGELEQASDDVIFLYRPYQYEKDKDKQNVTEVIVAKHRNGPVGSIELVYRAPLTRFENAATSYN